jgi:alanine racemase
VSRARLTIDLDALAHNHTVLCEAAGGAEVAPVLKADGYGLGAGPIARRLWAQGARRFFVARLSEGEALRADLAEPATIFVLDGLGGSPPARFAAADLTPILNSPADLDAWRDVGRPAGLHVDTGMNRLGVGAADLAGAADLNITLVMSHLACAADPLDPRNARQLAAFAGARRAFPGAAASLAASAGIFLGPDYRFDVVRPGISLFGGGPRERPDPQLAAVATLEAPSLQIRDLNAGDQVGYGEGFTAAGAMRVAILAAGYADGEIRSSKGAAIGRDCGRPAPVLVVSMDLIAVDVSDCPGAATGDFVELLGPRALLDDLAAAGGTVAHECLVRLSMRAERRYVGRVS